MKNLTIFLVTLFMWSTLSSQSKRDYYWPEGPRKLESSTDIRGMAFDFNTLPLSPELRDSDLGFNRTIASICDEEGKLMFYTNGCQVANWTHEFMENGDSLNFTSYYTDWLNGCESGYLSRQDILILPDPGSQSGYYIIHKPRDFALIDLEYKFWQAAIDYSYVDMDENMGLGRVTKKNNTVLDRSFQSSHLTAINHSNGRDWWILQPGLYDSTYYRILLDDTGFSKIDSQAIGPRFLLDEEVVGTSSGKSRFSPDGTKYAHFDLHEGLHLYDFDRETGLLSNGRYLDWEITNRYTWAGSIEFSPNSRYIYLINQIELYQIDTYAENLEDGLFFIDDVDSTIQAPFITTFFDMLLAPDCKLYVRTGSSSTLMHTIHDPNAHGLACDFKQGDLVLPRTSSLGGFPTFPPFRVDEENKCDPTISMVDGVNSFWRRDLKVGPNPAYEDLQIKIPESQSGYLRISDMTGIILHQSYLYEGVITENIDISHYSSGMYFVEFLPEKNFEKVIYMTKIVRQ